MLRPIIPSLFWHPTLLALLIVVGSLLPEGHAESHAESLPTRLRWRNGDELQGEIFRATNDKLCFGSSLFSDLLELSISQLSTLTFPQKLSLDEKLSPADSFPEYPFEVILKNGDRFRANLVEIRPTEFVFHTPLVINAVAIHRNSLRRIIRVSGDGHAFVGSTDKDAVSSRGRNRTPADWENSPTGELYTRQWLANFFDAMDLPPRVEVRFHLRFPEGSPDIEVGLLRVPELGPKLETWQGKLILTFGNHFTPAMDLSPETRDLNLRLLWDQELGKVILCDAQGTTLAAIEGKVSGENPEPGKRNTDPLRRGFHIMSRNPAMEIASVYAFAWDGESAAKLSADQDSLRWQNGALQSDTGQISLAKGDTILHMGDADRALSELVEWAFHSDSNETRSSLRDQDTRVSWSNGAAISGECLRVGATGIVLRPSWSDRELEATLKEAREVRFAAPTAPIERGPDLLSIDDVSLHGTVHLIAAEENRATAPFIAWQTAGMDTPVAFPKNNSVTITRSPPALPLSKANEPLFWERLHTTTDELIVGDFVSLDPQSSRLDSLFTTENRFDIRTLRSIDLGYSSRIFEDFRDTEWQIVGEDAEDADDKNSNKSQIQAQVALIDKGTLYNPSLLLGDRIDFDVESTIPASNYLRLRLFVSRSDPDQTASYIDFNFSNDEKLVHVGRITRPDGRGFEGAAHDFSGTTARISVLVHSRYAEVFVDGKSVTKLACDPSQRLGNGIQILKSPREPVRKGAFRIQNFRIRSSPASYPRVYLDPTAERYSLSIPRTLHEQVPLWLLVGQNGDLLRGSLVKADKKLVTFQVDGETLELPRSQVASIVRLDEPTDTQNTPFTPLAESSVQDWDDLYTPTREESDPFYAPRSDSLRESLAQYPATVTHSLILLDGTRLHLQGLAAGQGILEGNSHDNVRYHIPLEQIYRLTYTAPTSLDLSPSLSANPLEDWKLSFTPEPNLPTEDGSSDSPLIDKPAPDFTLSLLDGSTYSLSEQKGKVLVLQFWATWSHPCVTAIPMLRSAVSTFPAGDISLLLVNQGESSPLVSSFLDLRKWQDTPVALDSDQKVGKLYGASSLPLTVVIRPDGTVSWVHSGADNDLRNNLIQAISQARQK